MAYDLQQLAEEHAASPSPASREAVVLSAVPLVRSIVGKLTVPDHPLASREDLENVGLMGLLQALDSYDTERGTPFVSFAYGRIRGALVDYLRSIDALPRERRRQLAQAQQAVDTLRQAMGDEPDDADVADYLGISLSAYHGILTDAQRRFALSLHDTSGAEGEQPVLELIPNDNADDIEEQVELASTRDHVAALVRELPEREQNILALYYFEDLTLREIASLLGLTEARISQILGKVMLTLRKRLADTHRVAA
ncbi:MAG TPA: FliA/WhiG family RNA polymerase sigma factor [Rhodothermales bacterium]